MCHAPAELFRIENRGFIREGYQADLCIFRKAPWTVTKENILYQCGWSPLENQTFTYKVQTTLVNGHVVYDKGDFIPTVQANDSLLNGKYPYRM